MGRARRRWGLGGLAVALLAGGLFWTLRDDGVPPVHEDLRRFDEIDLSDLRGSEVRFGSTRSDVVPVRVDRSGRGETSLTIIDAEAGTVTDAGALPVDGWAIDALPEASERYVAMVTHVCSVEPGETDSGPDCTNDGPDAEPPIELLIYDIEADTWTTRTIGSIPDRWVVLDDVDGDTATLRLLGAAGRLVDTWATVDLSDPEVPEEYTPEDPTPAAPGSGRQPWEEPWTGEGWTMTNPEAELGEVTWSGTIDGEPRSFDIPPVGKFHRTRRCVLIASGGIELEHLHRVCAS